MNHDATHCADYTTACPKSCYRAELTADLRKRTDLLWLPMSFSHFKGTEECPQISETTERRMIMGLDVSVIRRKDLVCPKCGEVVSTISMNDVDSGGRVWYSFLKSIGYYVPCDQRTEENNWYGKDMKLTEEQTIKLYEFVKKNDPLCADEIMGLIALARMEGQDVIINADW